MRLKEGFITHMGAEEHITVSAGGREFNGMIRSNQTAGYILESLKKDVSEADIVDYLYEKYDQSKSQIKEDVETIIQKLHSIGAIDE